MTAASDKGFTIIEVVLFLAITGILFAALMAGVGTNIARQNYVEGVRSFKALLQDQFAEAMNARQEDGNPAACDAATGRVETGGAARAERRGSSGCVILGRIVEVTNNGAAVRVASVTGLDTALASAGLGDIAALNAAEPAIADINGQTIDLDGGITLRAPVSGGASRYSTAAVLFVRSPVSGSMRTFVADSVPTALKDMITQGNQRELTNCFDGAVAVPTQVVRIDARVAGADAFNTGDAPTGTCAS